MALLLALTWLSPVQAASAAASDTATFTFTSTTNPSLYLVDTTFQLSATGTNSTYPPFGLVTFYADGVEIPGCSGKYLNYSSSPTSGIAAACTTNDLSIGDHVITAFFYSYMSELYESTTVTLPGGHKVSYNELTISPDTLPNGQWMVGYSQILSTSGGDGSYVWSRSSTFPAGFSFYSDTGEIIGSTGTIGSSTFTVTVVDYAGGYGTKEYTLNITKATPSANVTIVNADSLYADTGVDLYLFANFTHPSNTGATQPTGTVSFSVDGVAVAACSGEHALPLDSNGSASYCTYNTTGLAAGTHTVLAEYTPADGDAYYIAVSGTKTFTISSARYDVTGSVFYDLDKDGVKDSTEGAPSIGFKVNYDINCDGEVDAYSWSENNISGNGEFTLPLQDSTSKFCVFLSLDSGYTQTTTVGPLALDEEKYFEIGVYYPDLLFNPVSLPKGSVNTPYSQTISISNGTSPYTISDVESHLPNGITFDPATLTLSGTPTQAYPGYLSFTVTDATGFTDEYSSNIVIQTDGTFTLTSSSNPSVSGGAVTFTFTGSGEAILPMFSETDPIPPVGMVTFYADNVAIVGCEKLYLNVDTATFSPGDYPATCTTSSLADGEHLIRAEYLDMTGGLFRGGTLTLTQVVGIQPDSTPPTVTPTIEGTLGSGGWYTGNINLIWTVADTESEITSMTGCDTISITGDQAETTYTCSAISMGGTTSVDTTIKRDATKPVITLTGVAEGAIYYPRNIPQAVCSTSDNLSGVATKATLTLSGPDTNGLGSITATCSGALDVAGNKADPVSVTYRVVRPADLAVFVIDSKDSVRPKTNLAYTLIVANLGPNPSMNVVLTDTLDPMTTVVSISKPRDWTCKVESNIITCTIARMNPGSIAFIKITTTVNRNAVPGKSLVNTANITSQTYDFYMANNSFTQRTRIIR